MASSRHPGEGLISTIANYAYWFLTSNFLFILFNLPFILVWSASFSQRKYSFSVLLVLSLLPTGPALAALLSVMGNLIRNKTIHPLREFFTAYKKNFLDALFWGGIVLAILVMLYMDILYIRTKPSLYFIQIILLAAGTLVISMTFYIFPIISRFYFKFTDVLKLSLYYAIKKFYITLFNFICLLGIVILISKLPSYFLLFAASVFCYVLMLNERNILEEIENKYKG